MHSLTRLIKDDLKPAFGVTEPGAIAFAVASARQHTNGTIECVNVTMNSGIFKNAFTCGIPNSKEVGNLFAAALGAVAGKSDKGLEALSDVTEEDNIAAKRLIDEGRVTAELGEISSVIFIEATVRTTEDTCVVTLRDTHTNIIKIVVNGTMLFEKVEDISTNESSLTEKTHEIHRYRLMDLYDYVNSVPLGELAFMRDAFTVDLALFEEGLKSERTTFARSLFKMNGNRVFSTDEHRTAQLLCNAAIEARVIGLDKPAMSITGSGAHGIIATLPLYAIYKTRDLTNESLLRATALSYLITMYIKEYSGRLSAFCGCAIAAGTGMACGMVYLSDGTYEDLTHTINNMASGITGMICDGGNQGCTMKGIVAVDAAFRAVQFAMNGVYIDEVHGINGRTPEETMRNMGLIASPGMVGTEKVILGIFESKLN
jgi:L-cysteine desulfidase